MGAYSHVFILLSLLTPAVASAIDVVPVIYETNRTPGGNQWYVDNGYTGTGPGLTGGIGELVDGVKGTTITSGYSQWEPYSLIDVGSGQADVVYTYHFDQRYAWDAIIQYQQVYHGAAVYQPSGFDIEFSIDGGLSYHSTVHRLMSDAESAVTKGAVVYSLLGAATGYHADAIRITLKQPSRWTATDEVEFIASAVVPEPRSTALILGGVAICWTFMRRRFSCT